MSELERSLVRPDNQIERTTRCSAADYAMSFVTTMAALRYRERLDASRLKRALALVLTDYSIYAGRLRRRRGELHIDHGVGGAVFELAETREQSSAFWGAATRAKDSRLLCPNFSPVRDLRSTNPLLGVRVTQTPDGSVLGVAWNHGIGDAFSATRFLRALGQAYRGQDYDKPVEVADRRAYLHERIPKLPDGTSYSRLLSWPEFFRACHYFVRVTRSLRRVALEFTDADISQIHAAAASSRAFVSAQDAVCAHIFVMLRGISDTEVSRHLAIAFNCRQRLGLPSDLLGNLSDFVRTTANATDNTSAVASALRAGVIAFGTGPITERDLASFQAKHSNSLALLRYIGDCWEPHRTNLILTNMSRLGWEEIVFESVPVSVHARGTTTTTGAAVGLLTLTKGAGGAGLIVDGLLPSSLADQLEREHVRSSPLRHMATRSLNSAEREGRDANR